MKVMICGIPHEIVECEDVFDNETHFGQIDYATCKITINKDLCEAEKEETIAHEILHGMLVHLGYDDYSQDEKFVQALSNAINQTFKIR